jgi:hypothetical protein
VIQITISHSGVDLETLPIDIQEKAIPKFIASAADYAQREMSLGSPVRTGRLRTSIEKKVERTKAFIGPIAPYAPYVESGTRPHEIRPVRARALRFVIGTEVVFAMRVQHPGTRPQPFVRETAAKLLNEISILWEKAFREVVS